MHELCFSGYSAPRIQRNLGSGVFGVLEDFVLPGGLEDLSLSSSEWPLLLLLLVVLRFWEPLLEDSDVFVDSKVFVAGVLPEEPTDVDPSPPAY
jgi:hypothetical protein